MYKNKNFILHLIKLKNTVTKKTSLASNQMLKFEATHLTPQILSIFLSKRKILINFYKMKVRNIFCIPKETDNKISTQRKCASATNKNQITVFDNLFKKFMLGRIIDWNQYENCHMILESWPKDCFYKTLNNFPT